jgi:MFS family permease
MGITGLFPGALKVLTRDGYLLFLTRFVRLFAYGSLSVILVFYLIGLGLSESQTGILLTLTLVGDTVISLYLTTRADRIGRRRMLIVGALLMAAAGLAFACTSNLVLLIIAGTIGVISPSGNEVGPFLSIEQAALSHVVPDRSRTEVFAWYTLAGSIATAMGALFAGTITRVLQGTTVTPVGVYRVVVILYAALGVLLACLFIRLSSEAEVRSPQEVSALPTTMKSFFGIGRSHRVVVKLSGLFALDSFAGGFVIQSFAAYWFYLRFGVNPATLGVIFFWANIFAGISALLAARLAARWGLINTMVITHLPSNILLILVPLMPSLWLAVLVLLVRFSISQMDVPTRQSYIMAVVSKEERSAAAGITGVARTTGAAISPLFGERYVKHSFQESSGGISKASHLAA